jgi:ABC-type transport system involved in Fe-S cluster assembly fused permease/ATPase subunit
MKDLDTKIYLQIRLRTITDCDIVIADCNGARAEAGAHRDPRVWFKSEN